MFLNLQFPMTRSTVLLYFYTREYFPSTDYIKAHGNRNHKLLGVWFFLKQIVLIYNIFADEIMALLQC